MFRFWYGPVVGMRVSGAWIGYAACLFLEFGTPDHETLRDKIGRPNRKVTKGEWSLSTMEYGPRWRVSLQGRSLVKSDSVDRQRNWALSRLVGRRLHSLEVDEQTFATRLRFSQGLSLETERIPPSLWRPSFQPHWLITNRNTRRDIKWPHITVLRGRVRPWKTGF